jgi:hypothetical protein
MTKNTLPSLKKVYVLKTYTLNCPDSIKNAVGELEDYEHVSKVSSQRYKDSEYKLFNKLNTEQHDYMMHIVWGTDLPFYDPVTDSGEGGGGGGGCCCCRLECVCSEFILLFPCPSTNYSVKEQYLKSLLIYNAVKSKYYGMYSLKKLTLHGPDNSMSCIWDYRVSGWIFSCPCKMVRSPKVIQVLQKELFLIT